MKSRLIQKMPGSKLKCGVNCLIPIRFTKRFKVNISKKHYAGKPTKQYLDLQKKLRQAGEVSEADLQNLLKR
jgi:hypothetical protein